MAGLAAAVLLWGLWRGMHCFAIARDLLDTPLSRLRSVVQGYVAIEGLAQLMPGPTILSPLTGTHCAWWSYSVEYGRGKQRDIIAKATSDDLFYLVDDSGRCVVDPVGASIEPGVSRSWRGAGEQPGRIPEPGWDALFTFGPYTYRERLVLLNASVFARGWYHTQRAVQDGGEQQDLRELLVQWKQDRRTLLQRFDADHDGEIDQQEWETARAAALEKFAPNGSARRPRRTVMCSASRPTTAPTSSAPVADRSWCVVGASAALWRWHWDCWREGTSPHGWRPSDDPSGLPGNQSSLCAASFRAGHPAITKHYSLRDNGSRTMQRQPRARSISWLVE